VVDIQSRGIGINHSHRYRSHQRYGSTERYKKEGRLHNRKDLHAAIMEGAVDRVRPKIMTVATTLIGLLPIMIGGEMEIGASVMKRIAAPMVGGLITSTIQTLIVIPAIYSVWQGSRYPKEPKKAKNEEE